MAKRPVKPAGLRALRARYGHELEAIRRDYEARAVDLRAAARKLESDYRVLSRQFRKDVAAAKRLGVAPKGVDARSARPTSALGRLLNLVKDFGSAAGPALAPKVSKPVARKLKAEGYTVRNGRVLLSPDKTVRRGEVVPVGEPRALRPIRRIRMTGDIEAQVDRIFATVKPGQFIGVNWQKGRFSELFGADDVVLFREYLLKYKPADLDGMFDDEDEDEEGEGRGLVLTLFTLNARDLADYEKRRARAQLEREKLRQKAKRAKRREIARAHKEVLEAGFRPKRPLSTRAGRRGRQSKNRG